MNKKFNRIFALLIYSTATLWAMEEQEPMPTSPIESASSEGGSSSASSPSTSTKKSNLKQTAREGDKKKLQFTADTQEHVKKPLTHVSPMQSQESQKEKLTLDLEQLALSRQHNAALTQEQAQKRLIEFAATALPETKEAIDQCAKDLVGIWHFFSIIPNNRDDAQENYAKLRIYTRNLTVVIIDTLNPFTGTTSPSLFESYKQILLDYKTDAGYQEGGNRSVDELSALLSSNLHGPIYKKAISLYQQTKIEGFNKQLSKIRSNLDDLQKYRNAVFFGHQCLEDSRKTAYIVDQEMIRFGIRGYSLRDYSIYLADKAMAEKCILIKRLLPYAEKVEKSVANLCLVFDVPEDLYKMLMINL